MMRKLGLIAGNGKFPLIFAEEAKRQNVFLVAVAHRGETSQAIETLADAVTWIYVGELGKMIRTFQEAGVQEVVMAGGIRKVRLFSNFKPDLKGAAFLARVRSRDDDRLLRAVASELAAEGIQVLESTIFLSRIIPDEGTLTRRAPTERQWEDVRLGIKVAKAVGRLGVGQTVVVKDRVVLAIEAIEGTDAAIRRGGILGKGGVVVVKMSKPEQDLRFDVPAVGLNTVQVLKEAGGAVLAVDAGKTIFLEKDDVVQGADRAGIVITAVTC